MVRSLYDCESVPVGSQGVRCRVVVATHPATKKKSPVGVTRAGIVYELFFTRLAQRAFTACDVVELYLHRGAFEPILADEDSEQDPDRWCSHSAWGQECWQLISQWVWNLRLELGHQLEPTPLRLTEFAPAIPQHREQVATPPTSSAPASGYGPPTTATRLGKLVASAAQIFRSNPMGRFGVQQGNRFLPRSGVEKPMGAYVWCMPQAFAVAALARCASSVNGMVVPPRSRSPRECALASSRCRSSPAPMA
jgi:hypothetical protein